MGVSASEELVMLFHFLTRVLVIQEYSLLQINQAANLQFGHFSVGVMLQSNVY